MKSLATIVIIIFFSSCSLFYKVVFGVKNPKMENYQSINTYVKSLKLDSTQVVFSKDSSSYHYLNHSFRGSPDIIVFDFQKNFIPYKSDTLTCNASVDVILKGICSFKKNNIQHAPVIYNDFIEHLDDPNNALEKLNSQEYDYLVFVDFVKYFHKLNMSHIPLWNNAFESRTGTCKAKIVYVNLDYLTSWNISQESIPKIRLSAKGK